MFDAANFRDKMATLERRHEEVAALLGTPDVINKRAEFMKLSREHAELDPLVNAWKAYQKLLADLAQARELADKESDGDLRERAREEAGERDERPDPVGEELRMLLL